MAKRLSQSKPSPQSTIDSINSLLSGQTIHTQVVRERSSSSSSGQQLQRRFHADFAEPLHLLVPVAAAAADLLCDGDLSLVKKCENSACILYFYDTTKNHARRWCSMSGCGNRAKVAAHYERTRIKAREEE
ncbi:MAG: CGNR zinc finger domain-containing protein [Pyrinomonadaceae bacterium]